MSILLLILIIIFSVMYFEGIICAAVIITASNFPRWLKVFFVLLWPIALPIAGVKLYKKFSPLIKDIKDNPLLKMMMQTQLGNTAPSLFDDGGEFSFEKQVAVFRMFNCQEIPETSDQKTSDTSDDKKEEETN